MPPSCSPPFPQLSKWSEGHGLPQELSRHAKGLLQGEHPAPAAGQAAASAGVPQPSPEEETFDHSFYIFGGYQVTHAPKAATFPNIAMTRLHGIVTCNGLSGPKI